MVRVLPIHFGVVLGCKGGGGEKQLFRPQKVFQVQAFQTEYRPDIPPRQGLKVYFGVRLQRWVEEKHFLGPEKFFQMHSKQSIGQIFHHARA